MNIVRSIFKLAGIVFILLIGLFAYFLFFRDPHSSDNVLIAKFESNKPKFVQLLAMLDEDSPATIIDPEWIQPDNIISPARRAEYNAIFAELALSKGLRKNDNYVEFIAGGFGLPSAGSAKGYIYHPNSEGPLFQNLDDLPKAGDRRMFYRKIDENWYLYYYWHD